MAQRKFEHKVVALDRRTASAQSLLTAAAEWSARVASGLEHALTIWLAHSKHNTPKTVRANFESSQAVVGEKHPRRDGATIRTAGRKHLKGGPGDLAFVNRALFH